MKSNFLCILLRAAIPFLNVMNVQKRRHFYCETHTHTHRQTNNHIQQKRGETCKKKFNLIIIIIPNFLACECLFLFTAEMEVILAIIILLCATFQRCCRHRRDCKLLFSPIATVVDMQTNGKHWRVFFRLCYCGELSRRFSCGYSIKSTLI